MIDTDVAYMRAALEEAKKAEMKDGILRIFLKQELPEEKKEKIIQIT